MTWGACKVISLQKMAALRDNNLTRSRDTDPYIHIMTAPANEAILFLTQACPLIKVLEIEQSVREGERQRRYDLSALAADFRRFGEEGVYVEQEGVSHKSFAWGLEAGKVLVLPNCEGLWRIYYEAYPTLLNEATRDSDPLPLPEEQAALVPLYIASQLFKDDDPAVAVALRNEFELGLSRLAGRQKLLGGDSFHSVRGWN
ncbi:MAG: hypothetical protein IJL39_00030 [Clostridia bacterium]|nr:hypothetical protein [Clostridia bacterium]